MRDLKQLAVFLCSRATATPLTFLDASHDALAIFSRRSSKRAGADNEVQNLAKRISRLPAAHRCLYFTTGCQAAAIASDAAAVKHEDSDTEQHIVVIGRPAGGEYLVHLRMPSTRQARTSSAHRSIAMPSSSCSLMERRADIDMAGTRTTDDSDSAHQHQEDLVKEIFEVIVFSISLLL
jgi:hypothetical protein